MRALIIFLLLAAGGLARADLDAELRWRPIGPYRGGRTKAAVGVPSRPGTFYIGACNGGVWKSTDYGRTWTPIFDDQPTGSIGAIAIAPSRPDTIYVGSGEGLQRPDLSTGDGIYKSTDAGRTWTHLGLRDGQQIPQIAIDPRNPERLFVAVLGHPYGPSEERGIFRSTDGGASFERVLHRDADTGGVDVVIDPVDTQIVYAVLWESRQAPWENGSFQGPGSGLFKSTDGGAHWTRLEKGLPTFERDGLGRIGVTIAPSDPSRLYATVDVKDGTYLYRSDDAGASWRRASDDERVVERGSDMAEVKVHPQDPDTVFTASVVAWKSTDGGKTFTAFRGAPGGDDYQRFWIDPIHPDVMLLASDQGAIVSVNAGATWSSWYNQPTAQLYHVSADNAFPYRVCGGQQESGSACVASRGGDGAIGYREWHPVGAEEYGYVVADPFDPDLVYGGKISRHDRRNGQTVDVTPAPLAGTPYRAIRTQPVLFAPTDPRALLFASNTLWRSRDGGQRWTSLSPDLSRPTWEAPASVGKYRGSDQAKATRRGVIYAVAASPLDGKLIWAGTDDGLIHVTRDGGKRWSDVTPPALGPWAKVSILEASHFDPAVAYAAINTLRLDDLKPHILRTGDFGKTWTEITGGLPAGATVNVVREDPRRKGLLFAGTELAVHVSFDDGAGWRPLRLNMPATSIRDLVVKDDDLVVATHGRGFWILDDMSPLRVERPGRGVFLYPPAPAWRVRWNNNTDTPLPPDEPTAPNPPDGAILDYVLDEPARSVTIEILDAAGAVVRRYLSETPAPPPGDEGNVPRRWIRPEPAPATGAGAHRFVWDLHHEHPWALTWRYPIAAIPGDTPREPRGPWALPGAYTVRLTVDGRSQTQPLTLRLDPRVKTPLAALKKQLTLSQRIVEGMRRGRVASVYLWKLRSRAAPEVAQKLAELEGNPEPEYGPRGAPNLTRLNGRLARVLGRIEDADVAPTAATVAAAEKELADLEVLLAAVAKLR